jgi:hypothetical protein
LKEPAVMRAFFIDEAEMIGTLFSASLLNLTMSRQKESNNENSKTHHAKDDKGRGKMQGAPSVSAADSKHHRKDDSDGAEKNTTKKQQNSI